MFGDVLREWSTSGGGRSGVGSGNWDTRYVVAWEPTRMRETLRYDDAAHVIQ